MLTLKAPADVPMNQNADLKEENHSNLLNATVTSFDWTNKTGFTTPIKNQQNCGASWAFAAVEVMETTYHIKHSNTTI